MDNKTQPYAIDNPECTAIFAAGCFWGVQYQLDRIPGVVRTIVGYSGGAEECPSYTEVKSHQTHHVEAVIAEFNPEIISYARLCQIFFEIHDPSQTDGIGPDIGPQYRSEIFYLSNGQQQVAESIMADLRSRGYEVNTVLRPACPFWVGEAYHQKYYDRTGDEPYCHIRIKKF